MHLVQAAGGRSKAAPYGFPGLWCNQVDAQAWWAQVKAVAGYVEAAAAGVPEPAGLASYRQNLGALEEPSAWMAFGAGDCGEIVSSYIASIEQAACLLETLDAKAGTVPGLPPPAAAPEDKLMSAIGLGAAALLAFALISRAK